MSAQSTEQTSETVSDGVQITEPAEPIADAQLGDAGKRALAALRTENKALKAQLKAIENPADAERDASEGAEPPSDGASDSATDVDGSHVATTGENVKPTPLRFQGT